MEGEKTWLWATGLPTRTALNVYVTHGTDTEGFPIGLQSDGVLEWLELETHSVGPGTVQITGPSKKNMATVKVYATCAMEVMSA